MPSAPTTSIDLSAADLVADPYPYFAQERSRHEVAWHESSGSWLTFSHAAAGAVLRNRRLAVAPDPAQPPVAQHDTRSRVREGQPGAAGLVPGYLVAAAFAV